ncbi:hypothetical protein NDU88_004904 [Pleurodeles waltl]|uniref:Uncharacterized protein n=1 Tax=Pleurodeles waltl TaxID=8319 RepID=A0AAV7UJF0_PLEWA|nr:hypothetical protein NDU88_004904 [Pleurodeles waltl]
MFQRKPSNTPLVSRNETTMGPTKTMKQVPPSIHYRSQSRTMQSEGSPDDTGVDYIPPTAHTIDPDKLEIWDTRAAIELSIGAFALDLGLLRDDYRKLSNGVKSDQTDLATLFPQQVAHSTELEDLCSQVGLLHSRAEPEA